MFKTITERLITLAIVILIVIGISTVLKFLPDWAGIVVVVGAVVAYVLLPTPKVKSNE